MQIQLYLIFGIIQLVQNVPLDATFKEKPLWIRQKLDHFNKSDTRTWKMRYLASDRYYKPGGPLFINVGGEWEVTYKDVLIGLYYELVKEFNAYSACTEHRYYGKSQPRPNWSVENLKYLDIKQALADLAHFIRHKRKTIPGMQNAKVVLFGCSYAGTMSIYFKREYPDLAAGIWAAGAPVWYRLDYSDGNVSIGKALRIVGGDPCYDRIENTTLTYLKLKKLKDNHILRDLKAKNITKGLEEIDMVTAVNIQHRNRTYLDKFCKTLVSFDNNDLVGMATYLTKELGKIPEMGSYNGTKINHESFGRQWLYQQCNGFGNFQTTSSMHQPFGNKSPFTKQVDRCRKEFGPKYTIDYVNSKIDEMNVKFGGYQPGIQNAYYTFSDLDPWRLTGIHDERATIIPGIGHCHEMRVRSEKDWPATKAAKQKGIDLIRSWINA
ncbi:probable serine protease EDA2 [Scaptodrosophila lebanonensis]|uniref:Probable serine protease EDA2 n=1 Tax=Drosophila lebanonensis TaxID=7225 RepID=A0A6J2UIE6_DROLE|nr:probable serine protease EDA2 [Scaptodrosophila lebanonensis]